MNAITGEPRVAVATPGGTLLGALRLAVLATSRQGHVPILSHVLLTCGPSGARIEATQVDCHLYLDLPGRTVGEGAMTFDPRPVIAALAATRADMPAHILTPGDDREDVRVVAGLAELRLPGLPPSDMPAPPNPPADAPSFTLNGETLRDMLRTVRHAISQEETRYYLNGAHLHRHEDRLRVVATDGHRIMWREVAAPADLPADLGVILPRPALRLLLRLMEAEAPDLVTVTIGGERGAQNALFQAPGWAVAARCIDGTFPSYGAIVPKPQDSAGHLIVHDPAELARCLAVATVGGEPAAPVALVRAGCGGVVLSGGAGYCGLARVMLPPSVATCTENWLLGGGLQARYLRDICEALPAGFALVANVKPEGPVSIEDAHAMGVTGCIMPMRGTPPTWEI